MMLFLLNLVLALLWLFLDGSPSLTSFVVGFGLGFALIAAAERLFPGSRYVERVSALLAFVLRFFRAYLASNLTLAAAVLFRRRQDMYPNFLTYRIDGLSPLEILVLSHAISLTPGTTVVLVSEDHRTLVLHAFDARDPAAVRRSIDEELRRPMLRWSR